MIRFRAADDMTEPEMREELAALRVKIATQGHLSVEEYDRATALFQALVTFDRLYARLEVLDGPAGESRLLRLVRERVSAEPN